MRQRFAPTPRASKGVLLIAASSALLLLVLELGARAWVRVASGAWPSSRAGAFYDEVGRMRRIYRRHPFLNTAPNPGAAVEVYGLRASLNSRGLRSPERDGAFEAGTQRVVTVGGSAVFDVLAPSDEKSWPWQLEKRLRGDGRKIEIWNAGFPGWTTLESLIALESRDLDLRPGLVLVMHGANDLQPASHRPFDPQYERGHAEVALRATGLELRPPWPWQRLVLIDRLSEWIYGPQDAWRALKYDGGAAGERRGAVEAAAPAVFERNLRSIAAVAASRGARVVLLTQPMRIRAGQRAADLAWLAGWYPELQPEAATVELERLNDVTRSLGVGTYGVARVADLSREVAWEDADFGDPLHFSEPGRAKLVTYFESLVESELVGNP